MPPNKVGRIKLWTPDPSPGEVHAPPWDQAVSVLGPPAQSVQNPGSRAVIPIELAHAKLLILGEAYGKTEERERMPFVGTSGYELNSWLRAAGINRADCYVTNVFNLRPHDNKIEEFTGPKAQALGGYPVFQKSKYIRAEFAPELRRLQSEILDVKPNLILALGATALWATTGQSTITKHRGTPWMSTHTVSGIKVLPTYHPTTIFRQSELRPTAIADCMKAAREREFPEIRRPARYIWIEPDLEDLYDFKRRYIDQSCDILSVDIETVGTQITCIGFAPRSDLALVVPFFDYRRKDHSYWTTAERERSAWDFVRCVLEGPVPKLFQNGLYDIAFLLRAMKIRVRNAQEDTMLLHHALQPESLKGLGYLGSIYTNEVAWKHMRAKGTIKRDD